MVSLPVSGRKTGTSVSGHTVAMRIVEEDLRVLASGLGPRPDRPARVIVVGAGMAGLVAASELLKAGHEPILLESGIRAAVEVHERAVRA
jgi:NADPH-dependent 2,4-dienoyl-CoA reductase/sulfur reductase-like enzyme